MLNSQAIVRVPNFYVIMRQNKKIIHLIKKSLHAYISFLRFNYHQ